MLSIDQIRRRFRDRNIAMIAREIGMTKQQLYNIVSGKTENPTIRTVERISRYFEESDRDCAKG